jgi:hypothetical protein
MAFKLFFYCDALIVESKLKMNILIEELIKAEIARRSE